MLIALTILVIIHHLAITYGAIGAWYYQDAHSDMSARIVLSILVAIDQAFFMGFFFLISGYFTPGSYDRKGGRAFLWAMLTSQQIFTDLSAASLMHWEQVFLYQSSQEAQVTKVECLPAM